MRFFLFAALMLASGAACAADEGDAANPGRVRVTEENDSLIQQGDKHYTQGMQLAYTSGFLARDGNWDNFFNWFADNLPVFETGNFKRQIEWTVVGQSLFTPRDTEDRSLDPRDRPYAAWLYTGGALLQETRHDSHDTLENTELLAGIVGPPALGALTQNNFHQFIGVDIARGWTNELRTEPGFILSYERKWRFQQPLGGRFAIDAIPELGASGGNILTYAETGGLIRIGQNLAADYGPSRIRPALSGTGWFDETRLTGRWGWYLFAGTQGRAVVRNIFLDGNTLSESASVPKKTLVADFMGGVALFWSSSARLDFTYLQRTPEFNGQGHPDRFGGINFTFHF